MNRSIIRIATILCIVALVVCGGQILGKSIFSGTHYANAEQYTAGDTTLDGAVKHLDINWTDGSVTLAYHDKDTVEISETAPKAISEDARLRWWLDGDTLRIQYAKSGYFTFRGQKKALTVTLPEGTELGSVDIDVTSGDVIAPELRADDILMDLTSGDVALTQVGAAKRMAISCTSGDITATVGQVDALTLSGTSSHMDLTLDHVRDLSVSTTSGDIRVAGGEAEKAGINSTSGKIDVGLSAFDALNIDVTSGSVTAALPSAPGYRADVSTTSGHFDYTVPLSRDGNAYTCGDGSGQLHIDTTSGNVRLVEAE